MACDGQPPLIDLDNFVKLGLNSEKRHSLTAFFETNISGSSANQAGDSMSVMILYVTINTIHH